MSLLRFGLGSPKHLGSVRLRSEVEHGVDEHRVVSPPQRLRRSARAALPRFRVGRPGGRVSGAAPQFWVATPFGGTASYTRTRGTAGAHGNGCTTPVLKGKHESFWSPDPLLRSLAVYTHWSLAVYTTHFWSLP